MKIKRIVRLDIWEKNDGGTILTEKARMTVQQHAGAGMAFPAIGTVFNVTTTDGQSFLAEQIGSVLFIPLSAPEWGEAALHHRFQLGD